MRECGGGFLTRAPSYESFIRMMDCVLFTRRKFVTLSRLGGVCVCAIKGPARIRGRRKVQGISLLLSSSSLLFYDTVHR
jgi:hypothetical protein